MTVIDRELWRRFRADGMLPRRDSYETRVAAMNHVARVVFDTNGRATVRIDGYDVELKLEEDRDYTPNQGEWCDGPVQLVERRVPVQGGEVIFRSPDRYRVKRKSDRGEHVYVKPHVAAAVHAGHLFEEGYSRGEAVRLGSRYAHEDVDRVFQQDPPSAKKHTRRGVDIWSPLQVTATVRREGLVLAEDNQYGFASDDDPDFIARESWDLAKEVVSEAKEKLRRLTDTAPVTDPSDEFLAEQRTEDLWALLASVERELMGRADYWPAQLPAAERAVLVQHVAEATVCAHDLWTTASLAQLIVNLTHMGREDRVPTFVAADVDWQRVLIICAACAAGCMPVWSAPRKKEGG